MKRNSNLLFKFIMLMMMIFTCIQKIPGRSFFDFKITDWQSDISGDYWWKEREYKNSPFSGTFVRRSYFEEFLIATKGSVYHPNLFTYEISPTFGFSQGGNYYKTVNKKQPLDRGFLARALLRGTLLQVRPFRTTAYYSGDYGKYQGDFFSDMNRGSNRWGIQTGWRGPKVPLTLDFSSDTRTENFSTRSIEVDEKKVFGIVRWKRIGKTDGNVRLNHTYLNRTEKGFYNNRQLNSGGNANFSYKFNPEKPAYYRSNLYGNHISGSYKNSNIIWNNSIQNIKFGENIQTDFTQSAQYMTTEKNEINRHNAGASLSHQLYQSLKTTGGISANLFSDKSFMQRELAFPVRWDYKKSLPGGVLNLNLGIKPELKAIESNFGMLRYSEYISSFRENNTIIIPQKGVDGETVSLYNSDATVKYIRDLDYLVSSYDKYYQVLLIPGSSIPDSADVLIRYTFEGEADGDIYTSKFNYGISYRTAKRVMFGYRGAAVRYFSPEEPEWWITDQKTFHQLFVRTDNKPFSIGYTWELSESQIIPYSAFIVNIDLILGSYVKRYLLTSSKMIWKTMKSQDDKQEDFQYSVEGFNRFGNAFRVKMRWEQRRVFGDLTNLRKNTLDIILKYQVRHWYASAEYKQTFYTFSGRMDTDKRCIVKLGLHH